MLARRNKFVRPAWLILVVLLMGFASAETATISYVPDTPVILDVPFNIHLSMNADANVKNVKLYSRAGDNLVFEQPLFRGGDYWLSQVTQVDNRLLELDKLWLFSVGPAGSANTAAGTRKVATIKGRIKGLTGGIPNTGAVSLDANNAGNMEVGIFPQGTFTISGGNAVTINTQLSSCGDGVVGYIDDSAGGGTKDNGIKDGTEANEACDEGKDGLGNDKNVAVGGCSADCKYIELGSDCSNKQFGERNSVCAKIPAKEYFLVKLTALFNAQCYPLTTPICTHPQALYKDTNKDATNPMPKIAYNSDGKLSLDEKIYLVAQVSAALREFLAEVT